MGKYIEFGSVVVVVVVDVDVSGKFEGEVFMHTCVDREHGDLIKNFLS